MHDNHRVLHASLPHLPSTPHAHLKSCFGILVTSWIKMLICLKTVTLPKYPWISAVSYLWSRWKDWMFTIDMHSCRLLPILYSRAVRFYNHVYVCMYPFIIYLITTVNQMHCCTRSGWDGVSFPHSKHKVLSSPKLTCTTQEQQCCTLRLQVSSKWRTWKQSQVQEKLLLFFHFHTHIHASGRASSESIPHMFFKSDCIIIFLHQELGKLISIIWWQYAEFTGTAW